VSDLLKVGLNEKNNGNLKQIIFAQQFPSLHYALVITLCFVNNTTHCGGEKI